MNISYHMKSRVVTWVLQWPGEQTVAMLLENNMGYFSTGGLFIFLFFGQF